MSSEDNKKTNFADKFIRKSKETLGVNTKNEINKEEKELSKEDNASLSAQEEITNLQNKVGELHNKIKDLEQKSLRHMAFAQNIQKKSEEDIKNTRRRANFEFARDVLEIYDTLLLASQDLHDNFNKIQEVKNILDDESIDNEEELDEEENSSEDNDSNKVFFDNIKKGIDMTMNIFEKKINKYNIQKIGTVGEKFDYNKHQALKNVPSDEYESGYVVQVLKNGYLMENEILIPALVMVSE